MRRHIGILLLVLICFLVVKADSCGGGTPAQHTYTMRWTYDCSTFKVPASFNYGYVVGTGLTAYTTLGNLSVSPSCSSSQQFSVTGRSNKISALTTFYVRSFYTNPAQYSNAVLAHVGQTSKKDGLEITVVDEGARGE